MLARREIANNIIIWFDAKGNKCSAPKSFDQIQNWGLCLKHYGVLIFAGTTKDVKQELLTHLIFISDKDILLIRQNQKTII